MLEQMALAVAQLVITACVGAVSPVDVGAAGAVSDPPVLEP